MNILNVGWPLAVFTSTALCLDLWIAIYIHLQIFALHFAIFA
jgi:hypothetical protein